MRWLSCFLHDHRIERRINIINRLSFSFEGGPALAGRKISTRLYCTEKALWKLNWFLRDFGYDTELLGRDEIDDKAMVGLRGVVKVLHSTVNGSTFLNLDGFAPASNWDEFRLESGVSRDLQLHASQPIHRVPTALPL